jgi:hypothetical protein
MTEHQSLALPYSQAFLGNLGFQGERPGFLRQCTLVIWPLTVPAACWLAAIRRMPQRQSLGSCGFFAGGLTHCSPTSNRGLEHLHWIAPTEKEVASATLLKDLLKNLSEIPATLDFDAFGRMSEYFLGEFAMSEGQIALEAIA